MYPILSDILFCVVLYLMSVYLSACECVRRTVCACVRACVCVRERERVCVCVCVCVRERVCVLVTIIHFWTLIFTPGS